MTTQLIDGIERNIVNASEWEQANQAMLAKEKAHMAASDRLAAERRTMPWLAMDTSYQFVGTTGKSDLAGLFKGRKQLIVYHFMFGPKINGWPNAGCVGCSMFLDQVGHLSHLHARDVEFALVSPAPLEHLEGYRKSMGWNVPWYSGPEAFNTACNVSDEQGNSFGLSFFYREGSKVYRTYFVSRRGVEAYGTLWSFLDSTPLGRQEDWEQSPSGTPQGPLYQWWRRHNEYEATPKKSCGCCSCE